MERTIDEKYKELFDSIYSEQATLLDKALIGVSKRHCRNKTLRDKVITNLKGIFKDDSTLEGQWKGQDVFKNENLSQNIRYEDAIILVSKFLKDNNLE